MFCYLVTRLRGAVSLTTHEKLTKKELFKFFKKMEKPYIHNIMCVVYKKSPRDGLMK